MALSTSSRRCSKACLAAAVIFTTMSMASAFAPATPITANSFSTAPAKFVKGIESRNSFLHLSSTVTAEKSNPKAQGKLSAKKKMKNPANKKYKTGKRSTKKNSKATRDGTQKKNGTPQKSFKALKDLTLGSTVPGTVVDVCDFGAFVNIGYNARALLHISQIRDTRIENIHDVVKVGDVIEKARVTKVDLKKNEVALSLRKQRTERSVASEFKVGQDLEGRVDSVVPYGAFIDVGANINALLHISRINGGAIENIRHHLNEGDPVSVHVIDVDAGKKTMAVSMLDKTADQYLDRRMSQRMKKYYGTASKAMEGDADGTSELDYFDQAIQELEEALRGGP